MSACRPGPSVHSEVQCSSAAPLPTSGETGQAQRYVSPLAPGEVRSVLCHRQPPAQIRHRTLLLPPALDRNRAPLTSPAPRHHRSEHRTEQLVGSSKNTPFSLHHRPCSPSGPPPE